MRPVIQSVWLNPLTAMVLCVRLESLAISMAATYPMRILTVCLLIAVLAPSSASAEGRCPPGSYPVGGQGVEGCAPIPAGAASQEQAQPVGKWVKTWGAIATASSGEVGVAIQKRSKGAASAEALLQCSQGGGKNCKVAETYNNQCVAVVSPDTAEKGGTTISRAATAEIATQLAMSTCTTRGSVGCKVLYSACTTPLFDRF